MVLFPFRRERKQRFSGIIGMIIGAFLMIVSNKILELFGFNGFITGAIMFFIGLLYFLDAQ